MDIQLLLNHAKDLSYQALRRQEPVCTCFYRAEEQEELTHALPKSMRYALYGGYEEAERQVLVFLPEYLDYETFLAGEKENPTSLICLKIEAKGKKFAESLTHRDYLGALMGLGVERDTIGDILLGEGEAYAYVLPVVALEAKTLSEVKHTAVKVSEVPLDECPYRPKKEIIKATVASLRLDAIISEAFHLSRRQAEDFIKEGLVHVGPNEVLQPSKEIKPGQRIAVKGKGKMMFLEELGESRKGKIIISFALFK